MINDAFKSEPGRLSGKTVLLVTDVPAELETFPNQNSGLLIRFEEALLGLTRAVLSEGGQLVVYSSIDVSLFISSVAMEYTPPRFAESRNVERTTTNQTGNSLLNIYFSEELPNSFRADVDIVGDAGYADIHSNRDLRNIIRENRPDVLVCIGGKEDVTDRAVKEFRHFRRNGRIYTIESTGGAAARLVKGREEIRPFDSDFLERLKILDQATHSEARIDFSDEIELPPFPVIMQEIVSQVADRDG